MTEMLIRCIAVDEKGNVVDGDLILYVCGKYLMENGRLEWKYDCYNCNVKSGTCTRHVTRVGMKYEKTAVGDKYVYENMMQERLCSWRRAVRTYYFQQTCNNRRRNPDFTYDDGSNSGEENEALSKLCRACKDLSTASSRMSV